MAELSDDVQLDSQTIEHSGIRRALAWGVHLLTASGVVCCLLALEATYASQWRTALAWLVLAVIIDAIDGTFARLVKVRKVLPDFDGTLLDNLIDFTNYVIVPALIIHRAQLLPAEYLILDGVCHLSRFGLSILSKRRQDAGSLLQGIPVLLEHCSTLSVVDAPESAVESGHHRLVGADGVRADQIHLRDANQAVPQNHLAADRALGGHSAGDPVAVARAESDAGMVVDVVFRVLLFAELVPDTSTASSVLNDVGLACSGQRRGPVQSCRRPRNQPNRCQSAEHRQCAKGKVRRAVRCRQRVRYPNRDAQDRFSAAETQHQTHDCTRQRADPVGASAVQNHHQLWKQNHVDQIGAQVPQRIHTLHRKRQQRGGNANQDDRGSQHILHFAIAGARSQLRTIDVPNKHRRSRQDG